MIIIRNLFVDHSVPLIENALKIVEIDRTIEPEDFDGVALQGAGAPQFFNQDDME